MFKTLIGKNGYLFLQNDDAKELIVHNSNLLLCNSNLEDRYYNTKSKFLLIVIPNKCYVYKQFLPEPFDLKYRPALDKYKNSLHSHLLDCYDFLQNEDDVYYKTDTHINLKGNYIIYNKFIEKIATLFNIEIIPEIITIDKHQMTSLNECGVGIGDLTWSSNLGDQTLTDTTDTYYFSNDCHPFYMKYKIISNSSIRFLNKQLIDETLLHENEIVTWDIISNYIIYNQNLQATPLKILIFYDSFLLSILPMYLTMFKEIYLSKSVYSNELIERIKPDYIFEFRCERFLL